MSMQKLPKPGLKDRANVCEGLVEIWAYRKGKLFDYVSEKNLILYQGNAEVIRAVTSFNPSLTPRIITRMAIGDQGTIPSDSTVPKVPVKTANSLFHEIYRSDVDTSVQTLYSTTGFTYTGNTTNALDIITGLSSTTGITAGMIVAGTGIPLGTTVQSIVTPTSIQISNPATSSNSGINITFSGTVNQCQLTTTFAASNVPTTSFANPSQARVNEVGLVIIDPSAIAGIVRDPVFAPNANNSDEVLMTVRTFKSVPFDSAEDITITIRYTIFTE